MATEDTGFIEKIIGNVPCCNPYRADPGIVQTVRYADPANLH
ncbi:hypothetical protein XCR_2816 [Xanthomonas campestris pv. raphani 756C]|nr:hypothetical protein XCR_2816 [Xanthomonas campestris pv. raphani 756C]